MKLNNGAEVLQCFADFTPEEGMVDRRGLVLARKGAQFVVWTCGKNAGDEGWDCEHGDYFDENQLDQALYMFGLRLSRLLLTRNLMPMRRGVMGGPSESFAR